MVKPGYKQTEVGVIPDEWDVCPLGSIAHFHDSRRIPIKESDRIKMQGDYPYYGASGIIDYVNDYIFDGNYILLGEDGANIIDRSSRLAFVVSGKCWINNHAHVIEPHKNMDIHFLSEYLESISYDEYNTGTAQPKLNREKCNAIPVPIPPLPEQVCIANYLRECDHLTATIKKEISKKKAIKQGAMQELLTGKKRLPGFSGHWAIKTLSEISSEMVDGPFGSNLKTEHYTTDRQVRIIQLSNIGESGWSDANTKYTTFAHAAELSRCIVQPGSVLIAKMMPAGRAIICPDSEKGYILGSDVVKVIPNNSMDSRYLVYATKSQFYLDQIADDTQGSTRARTSVSKLRKTAILVPSKEEQIAIATVLYNMDSEIEALEQKLGKYRQVKQGMMQQLLTGKIRLTK
jgi:type I restriction enzyme S subunit